MMDYSPINYRRLDWFRYTPNVAYGWRDLILKGLNKNQSALVLGAYRGYMK